MTLRTRWLRFDAEHWVHWLLLGHTTVLVGWALWAFVVAFLGGVVLLALVPAAIAGLSGRFTSAWREERPWAWWVLTVLAGARLNAVCVGALLGSLGWLGGAFLVFDAVLLLFLLHPDCRARAASRPAPAARRNVRPCPEPRLGHDRTGALVVGGGRRA